MLQVVFPTVAFVMAGVFQLWMARYIATQRAPAYMPLGMRVMAVLAFVAAIGIAAGWIQPAYQNHICPHFDGYQGGPCRQD